MLIYSFVKNHHFFSSDNVKKALAQHGFAEHLADVVSSLQNEKDEYLQQRVQSSADFIVMLLIEGYKIDCILKFCCTSRLYASFCQGCK